MSTAREKTATMAGGARELPKWQPQQILCQSRKIFGMIFALANRVPNTMKNGKSFVKNP